MLLRSRKLKIRVCSFIRRFCVLVSVKGWRVGLNLIGENVMTFGGSA
jgi:hypothetical protein